MRMVQASFPRLKDRFVYEENGERKLVLKMILLLYNYYARRVCINQILNTHMTHLEHEANEEYVRPLL